MTQTFRPHGLPATVMPDSPLRRIAMTSPHTSANRSLDYAFLPLLLVVYALATFSPAPAWLERVTVPCWPGSVEVSTSKLILACLLFVAGLRTAMPSWPTNPFASAGVLALGITGRLAPLVGMIAITHVLAAFAVATIPMDIATGLLLVAAMPSANTSTAWTRRSAGSLGTCVGIVILTTVVSPLVIPSAMALAAGPAATTSAVSQRVFTSAGGELVAWVVIPMLVGMIGGWLCGARDGVPLGLAGAIGSLAAILAVNYLNASRGLPQLLANGHLLPLAGAAVGASLLVAFTYWSGGLMSRASGVAPAVGVAIGYSVGMSNTGLAGTLAAEAFPEPAVILYPIVLCTLVQHVMAAFIDLGRQKEACSPLPTSCRAAP